MLRIGQSLDSKLQTKKSGAGGLRFAKHATILRIGDAHNAVVL